MRKQRLKEVTQSYVQFLLLIADKAPEIHLQIVCIHLDLLQSKLAEGAQANALQEGLKRRRH